MLRFRTVDTRREEPCHGIESLRLFVKGGLAKFNGCAFDKFVLHLDGCERRYMTTGKGACRLWLLRKFRFAEFS